MSIACKAATDVDSQLSLIDEQETCDYNTNFNLGWTFFFLQLTIYVMSNIITLMLKFFFHLGNFKFDYWAFWSFVSLFDWAEISRSVFQTIEILQVITPSSPPSASQGRNADTGSQHIGHHSEEMMWLYNCMKNVPNSLS